MQKSETIGQIGAALAKAQRTMESARKDSSNPFFKSKYADLSSVWDACKEQLTENGIAVSQFPALIRGEDGKPVIVDVPEQFKDDPKLRMLIRVETMLVHESGEWLLDDLVVPVAFFDAQGAGSAITYARRYALAAIAGVTPDEDDDGNTASGNRGDSQRNKGWQKPATQKKEEPPAAKNGEGSNGHKKAETLIDHLKIFLAKTYGVKTLEDCNAILGNCCTPNDDGPLTMKYLESDNNAIQGATEEIEMYCKANKIEPAELLNSIKTVTA